MEQGQGTHCTEMGADKSAQNAPNNQNISSQSLSPRPKVWDFNEKRLHWASVVHGIQGPFEMKMASSYSCRKRLCVSRVAETILNLGSH